MEPWYKITTPRAEVREGRSFNPDEFAIALEQVVAGKAPEDYREPRQFVCSADVPPGDFLRRWGHRRYNIPAL